MYDVFLLYSHSELKRAVATRAHLVGRGLRVWMDDPGTEVDVSELGIPTGSLHEEVVAAAIADSGAFLALDSPAWRASDYCQRELSRAQRHGRRILYLNPGVSFPPNALPRDPHLNHLNVDPLDELLDQIRASTSFSSAQVRLDAVIAGRRTAPSRVPVWTRLTRTPGHREAVRLVAESTFGELLTDGQRQAIKQILQEEVDRTRWLRRMMTGWAAIVLVAALVSGVGFVASRQSQATAEQRAAQAESERWAAAALSERYSGPALQSAQRSVAAEQNDVSEEAMRLASSAADRLQTWPIPLHPDYTAIAFAPSGERIAATTGSTLLIVDARGDVASHPLDELGTHTLIRWSAESKLWILSRGLLREYAVGDGVLTPQRSFDGVTAFDLASDGRVVAGLASRALARLDDQDRWTTLGHAPSTITALLAADEHVFVSTESLETQRYTLVRDSATLDWTEELADSPVGVAGTDDEPRPLTEVLSERHGIFGYTRSETSRDEMTVCGDDVLLMLNKSSTASAVLRLSQDGRPESVLHSKWYLRSIACWGGVGVGAGRLFSGLWSEDGRGGPTLIESSDRWHTTSIALSPDGQRLATVSTAGILRIADRDSPSQDEFDALVSLAPLPDGSWLAQDFRGDLHRFDGTTLTSLGAQESQAFFAQSQGGTTVVLTEDGRLLRATDAGLDLIYLGSATFSISSWALSADGASVVIADRGGRLRIVTAPDGRVERLAELIDLQTDEHLADVAMQAGTIYAISSRGRLWAIDSASSTIRSVVEVAVVGSPSIVFRPGAKGGVVVASQSGQLVMMDQDLQVTTTRRIGTYGELQSSATGAVVLWVSKRTLVMDGEALALQDIIAFDGFEFLSSLVISVDGSAVALWQPVWSGWPTVSATGVDLLAAYRRGGVDPAAPSDLHAASLLQIPLPR